MIARPFVSCICITKNRRILLRRAVEYFYRSLYLYKLAGGDAELVIVDGSDKPNPHPDVSRSEAAHRYIHLPSNRSAVGHFHNVAVEASKGELVIQWDDDDWHNPYRIVRQAATLEAHRAEAFTFSSVYWWYHLSAGRACRSRSWGPGMGSTGALFAYHRSLWAKAPFQDVNEAEDVGWWNDHLARGTPFLDSQDSSLVVYLRHNVNGSPLSNYRFTDEDTLDARSLMGADVDFYDELGELLPLTPWNHPNAPGTRAHYINPLQNLHLRHFR
jgi:glycosyltransferase involved in cell wall biosynthesis